MRIIAIIFWLPGLIWGLIQWLRAWMYEAGWLKREKAPEGFSTLVVGNIAVGGSGKTPLVKYAVKILNEHGKNVAVLSRGYGRKSKGFYSVGEQEQLGKATAEQVGDEPLEIYRHFNGAIPVFVCESRVVGLNTMRQQLKGDWNIILDDAYQHLSLKADLYLLLSRADQPFFNDFVMPAGFLREFRVSAKRADVLVWTRWKKELNKEKYDQEARKYIHQEAKIWRVDFVQKPLLNRDGKALDKGTKIFSVCGLAVGNQFEQQLGQNHEIVGSERYHDHAIFSSLHFEKWREKMREKGAEYLVMSEKDAARIPQKIWEKEKQWIHTQYQVNWEEGTESDVKDFILYP